MRHQADDALPAIASAHSDRSLDVIYRRLPACRPSRVDSERPETGDSALIAPRPRVNPSAGKCGSIGWQPHDLDY